MDIFESLENLNVSEECFNDIMGIVEKLIIEADNENNNSNNNEPINFRKEQIAKRINQLIQSGEIDRVHQTKNGNAVIGDPNLADELNGYKKEIKDMDDNSDEDDSNNSDEDDNNNPKDKK